MCFVHKEEPRMCFTKHLVQCFAFASGWVGAGGGIGEIRTWGHKEAEQGDIGTGKDHVVVAVKVALMLLGLALILCSERDYRRLTCVQQGTN